MANSDEFSGKVGEQPIPTEQPHSGEAVRPAIFPNVNEFEKAFFAGPWEPMTGGKAFGIEELEKPAEKTEKLWGGLKPSLDGYIDQNQVPVERLEGESDREYFDRVVSSMYTLNQKTKGCWKDCWPVTALQINRTNCALGSLVAAEALIRSGIPEDEIEYGYPGFPASRSHAAIFARGMYIDQANGVVIPVLGERIVDGLKCYELDMEAVDEETRYKVPFRLVPTGPLHIGVVALVRNLDPMVEEATRLENPNPEAVVLVREFGIVSEPVYGIYSREHLLPPNWAPRRMRLQPEWQLEMTEVADRFNNEKPPM